MDRTVSSSPAVLGAPHARARASSASQRITKGSALRGQGGLHGIQVPHEAPVVVRLQVVRPGRGQRLQRVISSQLALPCISLSAALWQTSAAAFTTLSYADFYPGQPARTRAPRRCPAVQALR